MDELYKKIFDDPRLKENRLSSEHFVKDMDWIIKLGLISFHDDTLHLDEFTRNKLVQYLMNIQIPWKTKLPKAKQLS
ncbi:hypothetical protein [Candidatus Nitrosocosmicus arcticus]|uniref:Uncharacterized protein n=1 Tax=Candidatus Nitrosocosmicus arcticus TaxID=2035267 RepID=A0A557SRP4_9ARCH|nr:hypothetical protein [Candidatus Nitrosocosmicus arcticus]TVP39276.1 hypothetical protein NARC_170016 [Candidatus Nitrosocosmicus arcticus]